MIDVRIGEDVFCFVDGKRHGGVVLMVDDEGNALLEIYRVDDGVAWRMCTARRLRVPVLDLLVADS